MERVKSLQLFLAILFSFLSLAWVERSKVGAIKGVRYRERSKVSSTENARTAN